MPLPDRLLSVASRVPHRKREGVRALPWSQCVCSQRSVYRSIVLAIKQERLNSGVMRFVVSGDMNLARMVLFLRPPRIRRDNHARCEKVTSHDARFP